MADAYLLPRDIIRATGPDATTFLQGQLSQDIAGLPPGGSAWSWLLQPTGKVDALLRVSKVAADDLILDTDRGWGDAVLARLNRFKLRTKVDLGLLDWECVTVIPSPGDDPDPVAPAGGVAVGGALGVDLLGPDASAGWSLGSPAAYEALRIEAGWPVMGAELTERTIPAETGLIDQTVSFTKGCYTGQELVARIDSRGSNVPRRLRRLRLDASVSDGTELTLDGKVVGIVTSVAHDEGLGWIALAYVGRAVTPPASLRAGPVEAQVEDLPLAR